MYDCFAREGLAYFTLRQGCKLCTVRQLRSQSKQVYHKQSCFLRTLYIKSGDTRETVRSRSQNSKLTYGTSTCDLPTRCAPFALGLAPKPRRSPRVSAVACICCSTSSGCCLSNNCSEETSGQKKTTASNERATSLRLHSGASSRMLDIPPPSSMPSSQRSPTGGSLVAQRARCEHFRELPVFSNQHLRPVAWACGLQPADRPARDDQHAAHKPSAERPRRRLIADGLRLPPCAPAS